MKAMDILTQMQDIPAGYVTGAAEFRQGACRARLRRASVRRAWLVAAVIALGLLLVGCGVAYVLSMKDVRIAGGTETRDYALVDGVYVKDPHTVSTSVLSLAGLEGSDAYRACAEFYAFKTEYIDNMNAMMESGTLPENFFENDTYNKDLDAKAAELAERYGLKPEGAALDFRTTRNLCDALGVERFVRESGDISADIDGGCCYDTGNFYLNIGFTFPEDRGYEVRSSSGTLRWNRKDCFSRDYVTIVDSGDWVEYNYTTASGSEVLILTSPTQERGYFLCDRGEALISLWLNVNPEMLSEVGGVVSAEYAHMTQEQLELVADTIDFAIQPRVPNQADVDAQAQPPQEATQNGYTLSVKSVETDGYVARILVGVTAPEGTDLESMDLSTSMNFLEFTPISGESSGGRAFYSDVPDGDGLANTKDLLTEFTESTNDGSAPFGPGKTWTLWIVDLWADRYMTDERLVTEGEWTFDITFDETNGDYRELELLTEPVTAQAAAGWYEDGTDEVEECTLTSVVLRKFSMSITHEGPRSADFSVINREYRYIVLKDGTRIEAPGESHDPVDLDQVDYLLLPDGTKLPAPET